MRRVWIPSALMVMLVLAGCAGQSEPKAVETTRAAMDPDLGWIEGLVTDDSFLPLSGADVLLGQGRLSALTDEQGRFRFLDLPPGDYVLGIARAGYEAVRKDVKVAPGEMSETRVQLVALPVIHDPYHETVTKVAQMHVGWIYLTFLPWGLGLNNSAYNQLLCDPCRFSLQFPPGAVQVKSETLFKAGTRSQAINNQVYVAYARNATTGYGNQVHTRYYKHMDGQAWGEKTVAKDRMLDLWVNGDLSGINHELRVEVYTTFAYHGKLAAEFTALPPP